MPISGRRVEVVVVVGDRAEGLCVARSFEGLAERFHISVCTSLASGRKMIGEHPTHLVIADLRLPDGSGTDLLEPDSLWPLVFLAHQDDERKAVHAMKAGATDYILKTSPALADLPRVAERALREWRRSSRRAEICDRYETILAATSDIIAEIDLEGHCTWVNRAGVDFFGEAAPGSIESEIRPSVTRTLLAGDVEDLYVEQRCRRVDGAERLLGWWHRVLTDGAECKVGMLCTARDVTEARRLETDLQHAHKIEALGQLAASIAHDFNNVLMGITSCAQVALSELEATAPAFGEVGRIRKEALSAATLTRQLLAFARKQEIDVSTVDLCEVVAEVEPMMRRLLQPDVSVRVESPFDGAHVRGDRGQLEQSLINLVVNARDAMPHGGDLRVAVFGEDDLLVLEVSDTGCGMDERTKARVFEPYFTTKRAGAGTGLGLSTVYGIVTRLGGAIELESEIGEGTTVRIRLPRVANGVGDARPETEPPDFRPHPATVLVVDDHATTRRALNVLLAAAGYDVLVAASCEEALDQCAARGEGIDILLADLRLPDARGTELVDRMRAVRRPRATIFLSGMAPDDPDIASRLEAADTSFLGKPIDFDQLEREMLRLLSLDVETRGSRLAGA